MRADIESMNYVIFNCANIYEMHFVRKKQADFTQYQTNKAGFSKS